MDYNRAKEEIKNRWEEIISQITSPAKERVNGHTSYICPLCGHGTHGDGLAVNPRSKDRKGLKCFGSCNFSGDIIDLIGEVENITDYPEKLKRAGEYIGITIDGRSTAEEDFRPSAKPAQNQPKNERYTHVDIHTDTYTQPDTQSHIDYYRECQKHLEETDYHLKRGISKETATRFMLGYEPHFKVKGGEWEALIIPTGHYSYVARNTDPQAGDKDRYRNRGQSTPFNTKALEKAQKPIFITEGEIDALSIIEAGGEAIGLGSTANITLFINSYIKKQKPAQPLILALDNDAQGEKAQEELEHALEELGVAYYIYNPAGEHKDANEALRADREAFIQAVAHAEEAELEALREEYYSTSSYNHLQGFIDGITDSINTPAQSTGFTELDSTLDGGLYEGLYILGAITSLGKTTLALQIADQIAQSGRDVLIFSLEMARAELMSKSISRHTIIDVLDNGGDPRDAKTNRGITTGARYEHYSQTERELIKRAISSYSEYAPHILIHEGIGDIGTAQIRETVRKGAQLAEKEGRQPPVVLVDYIQILAPYDVRATDKQNTDKAVLELKRISRDYKTPVIGISSFNRASYKEEVTLEAFKESGALEYGADVLIGLQLKGAGEKNFNSTEAKQKNPRDIELVILKNRNGSTGNKVIFEYYPLFNYFKERG